jgi:hypothetical protein
VLPGLISGWALVKKNINLFIKSNDALKLVTLMNTFNLTQVVDFPTRITNNNGTLIDTIFVDTAINGKIQVKSFINGLSDNNSQIICLQNANTGLQQSVSQKKSRLINEQTIKHFQTLLKDEMWDSCISTPTENWTHIYINLFTRNSPYYHLLKYLLFLLKNPVHHSVLPS